MKHRLWNLLWKVAALLILAGALFAIILSRPDTAAQQAVVQTRSALRQQGFKTDLADFDFSTALGLRAREAVLLAAPNRGENPFRDFPNLMSPVDSDSVIVFWQEEFPRTQSGDVLWPLLREAMDEDRQPLDDACDAALSGLIRFNLDASRGDAMLLPHLAPLKNLVQMFNSRAMLDLHDGNKDAAWTNVLAATRLVTAWQPEPAEISHLVRFENMTLAFNATWQLLQTNGWPDEKLAALQSEWASADFFTNLPETAAFKRAADVAACQRERQQPFHAGNTFGEIFREALRYPWDALANFKYFWRQHDYRQSGSYEDEKNLLLFYRNREVELRNAVQSPTWSQMRQLPGGASQISFQSPYQSRMQMMNNLHRITMGFQNQGSGLLARAAEAEARRRILVTAIALERYHGKNGAYPRSLAALAPDFLKVVPVDFMDGQPLRYRLTNDGVFVLYSVGLDCVDDGGKMPSQKWLGALAVRPGNFGALPEGDIVWPRPASVAEINAVQQREQTVLENRADEMEEMLAGEEWNFTIKRQSEVEKLFAQNTKFASPDTTYRGRPLAEVLRNVEFSGTNRLSLAELLTLHQIITGAEPETITFEVPIAYDVLTNVGSLDLYVDPVTDTDSDVGAYALQCDFRRATNGDCLLAWSTIYECPGKHALTLGLTLNDLPPDKKDFGGPMLPFEVTNLCQFSLSSAHFDPQMGATWRARLPEKNGNYIVECNSTNGAHLKTLTGSTANGLIKVHWDLLDDHDRRLTDEFFNSVFHITLPDSGRTQTLNGP